MLLTQTVPVQQELKGQELKGQEHKVLERKGRVLEQRERALELELVRVPGLGPELVRVMVQVLEQVRVQVLAPGLELQHLLRHRRLPNLN